MMFMPTNFQIVERSFEPPIPTARDALIWPEAWQAALDFWTSIEADKRIAVDFRAIAKAAKTKILQLEPVIRKLPSH